MIFAFVHGFRFEANKLKPEKIEYFVPHVKEQMLVKPCQIELIKLSNLPAS